MKTLPFALLLAGAAALAATDARAQVYETFAAETFEYAPGPLGFVTPPDGGIGWADKWYAGLSGYSFFVTSPSLDPIGNKATTNQEDVGAYRRIDTSGLGALADPNAQLGVDGTTIWVDFEIQKEVISNDEYGGLSLVEWLGPEHVFLGSPFQTNEWGFVSPGGVPLTVPGTDPYTPARLVYRIDFQAGDERVRMWIDPPSGHPDPLVTPPDLDGTAADFRFEEIRIQSGSSFDQTGYSFDAIELSAEAWRPVITVSNAVGGSAALIDMVNCSPLATVIIGYSMTGAGPVNTPLGPALLSPPIHQLPATADANGEVHLSFPLPPTLSGRTVYVHAGETAPNPALSNPLVVNIL